MLASKNSHGADFNENLDHTIMNFELKSPKPGAKMIFNQKWIRTWLICQAIWKSSYCIPKFFPFKRKTSLPWKKTISKGKDNLNRCVDDISRRFSEVQKIFEDVCIDIKYIQKTYMEMCIRDFFLWTCSGAFIFVSPGVIYMLVPKKKIHFLLPIKGD